MARIALVREGVVLRVVDSAPFDLATYPTADEKVDVTNVSPEPTAGDLWQGSSFVPASPAVVYKSYSYVAFLEKLTQGGGARALLRLKKTDTDQAADVELFMEMMKTNNGVDFNSAISRARLWSVVPDILSAAEAEEIQGAPNV